MTTPSNLSRAPRRAEQRTRDELITRRTSCRACGGQDFERFLDLGETPPANHYLSEDELGRQEYSFPLVAQRCTHCGLVQLLDVVEPAYLFADYAYFSSASAPVIEHFRAVAADLGARYELGSDDFVCEIGSNDGVFLRNLVGRTRILGVDPSSRAAALAGTHGVPTLMEFFSPTVARRIEEEHGSAKLILAANVFAHIDDMDSVMEGVDALLAEDGVLVIEVHRFANLLTSGCFDQIYHEHLSYWSLAALELLLGRWGLQPIWATTIPMQGESLQLHAARVGSRHRVDESVTQLRAEERALGIDDAEAIHAARARVERLIRDLRDELVSCRRAGLRVVGYGAAAKATTLLSAIAIGANEIDYIVDSTPAKQGKYMPGTHIPIRPLSALREDPPDVVLVLAWNYADQIIEQERELRATGVRFLVPIPEVKFV